MERPWGACPGNFEFYSGMKANNRNGNFANEKYQKRRGRTLHQDKILKIMVFFGTIAVDN